MKEQVLDSKKARLPVLDKEDADFEEDWKNGISGDEFLRREHNHIRKLYPSRSKK